ncbi:tudor domain-containing protein 3 [Telopea speciosissima]|uniref:tudor domain-containing protein 3 n=1 Tax=Telopea speciosissima TaxID=54955 RepID=UPI001CC4F11C|nr:tudor domain-containing protein 3 [Telopea speciosissima]
MANIPSSEAVLETLIHRGWCFRDLEDIKFLIQLNVATCSGLDYADSVESELLNMDLMSFGGKSLPDSSVIKKSSHLQGPKVLQIVSVRDVYQSTIESQSRNSRDRRLLRFVLTDGNSEVVAIEYSPIVAIADDIVPGAKVRLENKAAIHSGILCLKPKAVTVLGGLVQSLYEEWQMTRKYSGFSRSTLRLSQKNDGDGPPPFEQLKIGVCSQRNAQHHNSSYASESVPRASGPIFVKPGGGNVLNQTLDSKVDEMDGDQKAASLTGNPEGNPSSSESRPKEVAEAVPVQNQAAAQKLLQKMSQPSRDDRHSRPFRGPRNRGKEKQEEESLTLDEWERIKGGGKSQLRDEIQDISRDEEIAWQLQNQLNIEDSQDSHVKAGKDLDAEKIRMSMFNFERRDELRDQGRMGSRGRGRGRGRGRRRF